jgi:MATE family multidrug resistance protein
MPTPLDERSPATPGPPGPAIGASAFVPRRAEIRELLRLAAPVALAQVGMMSLGVVDTLMVGRVSSTDLAGVALGNVYFFAAAVFGMGTLFALDPVISQAVGAADDDGIARGLQRGVLMAVLLSGLALLLMLPAEAVLRALRQPTDVIPIAARYTWACMPGVLPFYLYVVQRQTLQAMGLLRAVLWAMFVANVGNVFFNWLFVFGGLGMPAMGGVGAGWASSLSRALMAVAILGFAWPRLHPYIWPVRPGTFARAPILRMFRVGAPAGIQFQLEFGAFGAAGILMGWVGTVAVAGHQIALNLASLTFMLPVGIAQAASVLVGRAVGAEDPGAARRAAGAGLLLSAGVMTGTAALFLTIPEGLARLYTPDQTVVLLTAGLLPIAGLFQVSDGIQVVSAAVLRGVGDTRIPMLVNLLGFWAIGLPVGAWLCFSRGLGAQGVWWGLALGLTAVALLLARRVRARFGRELRRLVIDAH